LKMIQEEDLLKLMKEELNVLKKKNL
jgi:hypothetical protein